MLSVGAVVPMKWNKGREQYDVEILKIFNKSLAIMAIASSSICSYMECIRFAENKCELNKLCNNVEKGRVTIDDIRSGDHDQANSTLMTTTSTAEDFVVPSAPKKMKISKLKAKPKAFPKVSIAAI